MVDYFELKDCLEDQQEMLDHLGLRYISYEMFFKYKQEYENKYGSLKRFNQVSVREQIEGIDKCDEYILCRIYESIEENNNKIRGF